jgi:hypothetical protein
MDGDALWLGIIAKHGIRLTAQGKYDWHFLLSRYGGSGRQQADPRQTIP